MNGMIHRVLTAFRQARLGWLKLTARQPEDIVEQRVVAGKTWDEFCDRLKSAGAALVYPGAPSDPASQAEGIRYLTRLTRAALEAFVEYSDPLFPEFRRMVHETVKMGADNPDNYYQNAQIDGKYEYIIRGKRNTIKYIGFFTQNGNYGTTGGMSPCGSLEGSELQIDDDGKFEIVLSNEPRGANWLRTERETGLVIVRQTFGDRVEEVPAELTIEAIAAKGVPEPLTAQRIDDGLRNAALFVAGAPMLFARWARQFRSHPNELPLFDPAVSNAAGGDANILYYHSYWVLKPDEALVIETGIPKCEMWNFQLNNYWMESLDYRYHRVCINQHSAAYEADGTVRVVVAHSDPGHPNWIDTCGHGEGTMCWRWYRPVNKSEAPEPSTRVVKLSGIQL